MCAVDENELADLTERAERLGFEIFCDRTCGYALRRTGRETTNLAAHSYTDLDDLRDVLDGIEWGGALGAPRSGSKVG
jgi:hypothetical protein